MANQAESIILSDALQLHHVLYVPNLTCNLICLPIALNLFL